MIECILRYPMTSEHGRTLRFERSAYFPAVPFQGSWLSLKDDSLEVDYVQFCEEAPPILVIRAAAIPDEQVEDTIDDMAECGWVVVSDVVK